MNNFKYANVIVNINHSEVDKIFDYAIPESISKKITKGMRVIVPFGANNKNIEGYVINISYSTSVEKNKIKEIVKLCDDFAIFSDEMISLAFWLKEKYYTTLSSCLKTIMPSGITSKFSYLVILKEHRLDVDDDERDIINFISENNNIIYKKDIEKFFGNNVDSILNSLVNKNIIDIKQQINTYRFENKIKYIKLNNYEKFEDMYKDICNSKKYIKQKEIIDFILCCKDFKVKYLNLKNKLNISNSTIKTLEKKGLISIWYETEKRKIFDIDDVEKTYFPNYTKEQLYAINKIETIRNSINKKPVLIFGVTGSGKTEIYMNIINNVIKDGKQAIMLVPEISLTPQIVTRFISRFGENVSFTHSRMSVGERFDQWKKAKCGEISVMIGPRSAIFTPFDNIGVIIIDEEHESSYKSEVTPKYDTIEVANKLSEITNSLLILGSATPNVLTYHNAVIGKYEIVELTKRANKSTMPKIYINDMRVEIENGNFSIFSSNLYNEIKKNICNKEQTILFLNRRGYSTFVSCRKCGYVLMCDNCNVSYTYHSNTKNLICHYCGKNIKNPSVCPSCGSKYIKYFGIGTQRVEQEIEKYFPDATFIRMDMDTTTKKNSHRNILKSFENEKIDILIGTQMIAKGHDFPNVTLVGIIAADVSLNAGTYKAFENTFQIITQVSGRAGRGEKKGRVYIQTYNPNNYAIKFASEHDYKSFYDEEISIRKIMEYPPFGCFFNIMLVSINEKDVIYISNNFANFMKNIDENGNFVILGPTPAFISKIKNEYRFTITVKHNDEEQLKNFVIYCLEKFKQKNNMFSVYINISMNNIIF